MLDDDINYNELCECGTTRGNHFAIGHAFSPSGNVSVPASLLDKVRALCESAPIDEHAHRVMVLYSALTAVREALAEIDKGE